MMCLVGIPSVVYYVCYVRKPAALIQQNYSELFTSGLIVCAVTGISCLFFYSIWSNEIVHALLYFAFNISSTVVSSMAFIVLILLQAHRSDVDISADAVDRGGENLSLLPTNEDKSATNSKKSVQLFCQNLSIMYGMLCLSNVLLVWWS
jgi:hypothetical protein